MARSLEADRTKLGLRVQMFTQVKLNKHSERAGERFKAAVDQFPEVVEVHRRRYFEPRRPNAGRLWSHR